MASPSTATRVSPPRRHGASAPATRFDRRLSEILIHATNVFCEKDMREPPCAICRAPAECRWLGLLLLRIQRTVALPHPEAHFHNRCATVERAIGWSERSRAAGSHLHSQSSGIFFGDPAAMKVLSHEAEALKNASLRKWRAINASITASAWGCWMN